MAKVGLGKFYDYKEQWIHFWTVASAAPGLDFSLPLLGKALIA